MPGKDGIEVCHELRQMNEFDDTIIAFLTARNESFTQISALDSGGDDFINKPIKKVAVLGGSGNFAINAAKAAGVDAFVTADLKYHDFFTAENEILLADIGHYESEQYTKNLLVTYLTKKIPNFAIILSNTNTNPVKYL